MSSTLKLKLNCQDLPNQVQYVTKTKHDSDMNNSIGQFAPEWNWTIVTNQTRYVNDEN